MGRVRKLEVQITESRKGTGLKDTADDVDRLNDKLRTSAREGGDDAGDEYDRSLSAKFAGIGQKLSGVLGRGLAAGIRPAAAVAAGALATQLVATLGPALLSGLQAVGAGLFAGLLLLPAAALAGVAAFGALKIAVSGVGDALSAGLSGDLVAFDDALAKLSPNAQSFAREVVGMKGGLDLLKASVQDRFFEPLVGAVQPLGELYLPRVRMALSDVAGAFGEAIARAASFFALPEVAGRVGLALQNARDALRGVASAAGLLPQALLPLVTVGASFLPQFTGGLRGAVVEFGQFMHTAERTGRLREWIQGGIDAVRGLIDTGQQVGRIFGDIGSVISAVFSGSGLSASAGGLLDTIEGLTSKVADFMQSAQGGEAIRVVFDGIGLAVLAVKGPLGALAAGVAGSLGGILPKVGDLITSLSRLAAVVLDIGVEALEPPVRAFGAALGFVLPPITNLANLLADNKPVLQGIGIAIMTFMVPAFIAWAVSAGAAAVATLAAALPFIVVGAAIAALAALVIIHFDTIKGAIMTAFNWVRDNWQLLLIILTGPIGIAVALVVTHFDTIKNAVMAAFNWVRDNWQLLLGILTGPVTAAYAVIIANFDSVVSFVTGLPGRITDAASGMWDGITGAFRSAINGIIGLWNGLSFPSVTIGGQDPLGDFGPSLPRVTIGGWDLPNIPLLATGGIIRARPGGSLFVGGERGHDEAVVPLDGRHSLGGDVKVTINLQGGDRQLMEWLRHRIRVEHGGNVQTALGQG